MSEKRDILSSIYICDGSFEKGDAGYPLIRLAAARYAGEKACLMRSSKPRSAERKEENPILQIFRWNFLCLTADRCGCA